MYTYIRARLHLVKKNRIFSIVSISGLAILLMIFNLSCYVGDATSSLETYRIGDWLINYQAGFVRRGLIGEIIFRISSIGLSITWITLVIQSITYLALGYFTLRLYFLQKRSSAWLLFLFSPVFIFLFPFYDPSGWYRKELLVFLAFVMQLFGLRQSHIRYTYLWISIILYFVAVFSHEMASLSLVFFLYPLYEASKRSERDLRLLRLLMGAYSLIAIAGLTFAIFYAGGQDASEGICRSLMLRGIDPGMCGGAIQYLSVDMRHGFREVMDKIHSRHYLLIYCLLFFLSAVPIILSNWWKRRLVLLILGCVSLAPLYLVGMDWGRWIAIFFSFIYLYLFFESSIEKIEIKSVSWALLISYILFWSVPHIQGKPIRLIETYLGSGPGLGVIDIGFAKLPQEVKHSPLRHPIWIELPKFFKGLIYIPLSKDANKQNIFYYFAKMNLITSNIKSKDHLIEDLIRDENNLNIKSIFSGVYSREYFYILDSKTAILALRHFDSSRDLIISVDGFYVLAPNLKLRLSAPLLADMSSQGELLDVLQIDKPIYFSKFNNQRSPFLIEGWSSSESWGTWSDGSSALILLPLPKETVHQLIVKMKPFIGSRQERQKIDIYINNILVKVVELSNAASDEIVVNLPKNIAPQEVIELKFNIAKPISPFELGMSADRRKLGLGIETIVLK